MNDEQQQSRDADLPPQVLVELPAPFTDDRGSIQPLVDRTIESCVLISSKKGSVRANHYHKTDWHYCYVLSGKIDYYYRETGGTGSVKKECIETGKMFFTPPMIDHTMVFLEDTTFLAFGRNSRKQESYESGIERIPPLNL